ncbi:MAG: gamma-butyrobetaine hydroxylase-like domain-containing protein [Chthoniobacterales bacterium]
MSQPLNSIKAVAVVGKELAISWHDGSEQYFSLKKLRQHCPCAQCMGEPDLMGKLEPLQNHLPSQKLESFSLKSYQFVGGYALQFFWMDGHNSGIYSYQYLRALNLL